MANAGTDRTGVCAGRRLHQRDERSTFNGLIESALTVGIEGASFIDAYSRREATRLVKSIKSDATLDEASARLLSIREGIGVVVTGNILQPKNVIRRNNAALYAMYAGDFEETARLSAEAQELNPSYEKSFLAQAFAQLALGHHEEALATYERLGKLTTRQARTSSSLGLIDLALYDGRQQDALKLLDAAIADTRAAGENSPSRACCRFAPRCSPHAATKRAPSVPLKKLSPPPATMASCLRPGAR